MQQSHFRINKINWVMTVSVSVLTRHSLRLNTQIYTYHIQQSTLSDSTQQISLPPPHTKHITTKCLWPSHNCICQDCFTTQGTSTIVTWRNISAILWRSCKHEACRYQCVSIDFSHCCVVWHHIGVLYLGRRSWMCWLLCRSTKCDEEIKMNNVMLADVEKHFHVSGKSPQEGQESERMPGSKWHQIHGKSIPSLLCSSSSLASCRTSKRGCDCNVGGWRRRDGCGCEEYGCTTTCERAQEETKWK